jgi:CRISPR/Cas system-associated exonuclease Cas4 (RecB family)
MEEDYSIQKLLSEKAQEHSNWDKDNWWISDIGKCPSGVFYARKGKEPTSPIDDRTARVFSVGKMFHGWVQDIIEENLDNALIEKNVKNEELNLTGRADIVLPDKGLVYELKSTHSKSFHWMRKTNGFPKEHHKKQLMAYMWLLGIKEGRVLYISKDDLSFSEYPVKYDEGIIEEIKDYFKLLNEAWEKDEPPEPVDSIVYDEGKDKWVLNWKARYCDYHEICAGEDWKKEARKQLKEKNS